MLVYSDSSGQRFRAHTSIGIVRSMRQAAWVAPGKQEYMHDVAKRIAVLDGGRSIIDTTNAATFLESLVAYGWLEPVQE